MALLSDVVALHCLLYGAVDKGVDRLSTGLCVGLYGYSARKADGIRRHWCKPSLRP